MRPQTRAAAIVLVVLLLVVAGALLLAIRMQTPTSTPTSQPTVAVATAFPTSPPTTTPTPAPTPEGFVLPQGCSYVGAPTRTTTTEWRFTCGGASDSAQRVAAALNQQGWAACLPQPGIAEWWKGPTTTRVTPAANASDPPYLLQYPRFVTNCP